jgi:sugar phosphate permease
MVGKSKAPSSVRVNNYTALKWINLTAFSLMYVLMYIGRYSFNAYLPDIASEIGFSADIEEMLSSSVFFAYAAGCLVNGYLADMYRPKLLIIFGAAGSVFANIAIHFTALWQLMLIFSLFNGFMQSMVWVSGIAIIVKWWRGEERGAAVGIANLSSSFSYILMLSIPDIMADSFGGFPVIALLIAAAVFYAVSCEKPSDAGLPEYEEPAGVKALEERLAAEVPRGLFAALGYFLKDRLIRYWCAVSILSSLCRYGVLTWLPLYYSSGDSVVILGSFESNAWLSFGMAFGTLVIAFIAGKYFNDNLGIAVTVCAAVCAAAALIFPALGVQETAMTGMFFTGFFLFGINGLLWLYAMRSGTRLYAATVTGILNCFAYAGAAFERRFFSSVLDIAGDWVSVFVSIDVICIGMVIIGCLICNRNIKKSLTNV